MTPQQTAPDLPVGVCQESLAEAWVMVAYGRLGALTVAVHAWDLLREVTIIFITSTTVSVQFSHSVVSTLCDPMNLSMPGLPVHHQLPECTQTHHSLAQGK